MTGCARAATRSRAAPRRCSSTSSPRTSSDFRTERAADGDGPHRRAGDPPADGARVRAEPFAAVAPPRAARRGRRPTASRASCGREMARLGWLGIVVPEQYGGAGLGWTDLMVVLEELGRGLVPEPMMGTVLLGATTLLLGGNEAQRSAHLPAVVAGEQLPGARVPGAGEPLRAPARRDARRARRAAAGCSAARRYTSSTGSVRTGSSSPRAPRARRATRQASRSSSCRADAHGLGIERQHRVDGRGAALAPSRRRPRRRRRAARRGGRRIAALLERVLDRAAIALSAEMLGGMARVLRDDARVSEDAQAVRRPDRQLPGSQASRRAHVRRAGAGALDRARRAPRARRGRRRRAGRVAWRAPPRRAAPTRSCWSATRACRCTAGSA